jgi:hypothetical protein
MSPYPRPTNPNLPEALLSQDPGTVGALSPDLQETLSVAAELLVKLEDQFKGLSSYEKGRIVGRAIFEVANLVVGGAVLKLGKAGLLNSLSKLEFFQDCAPAKAALTALQPTIAKLKTASAGFFLVVGSAKARSFDRLFSLYRYLCETEGLAPFAAFQRMLQLTAGSIKGDVALLWFSDILMQKELRPLKSIPP